MASLNLRVGASVDRNLQVAFRPLVEGAKRAAAAIEAENKKAARAIERDTKVATTNEAKAYAAAARDIEKWQKEAAKTAAKAKRDELRDFERAEREKTAIAKRESKERARSEAKQARENESAMRTVRREVRGVGGRLGGAMVGVARAGVGAAMGITSTLARSAGVDLDAGTILKKNLDLEAQALKLSNQAYQVGDKMNGQRVEARTLMNEALATAAATGTDGNDALTGLTKFVDTTGDLSTARAAFKDLSVLSKATGTNLEDMLQAAGQVSVALGEMPNKGEAINKVMRSFAGQGKLGAVEIKDLAVQMAKITASAGGFGGDRANTMATLGALAQESRASGGSTSAAGAATSVASFVSMLTTKRRAEEFERATGAKTFDVKTGMLRDPQKIIQEALAKVGMDPIKMKTIFANQQGARAMMGFANIYKQAGGGAAGAAAVDAEFARLKNAAISEAEIMESFNRAMKGSQSQAEVFNAQIRMSAMQMQDALMPALLSMAPAVVGVTKGLASFTTFLLGDKRVETTADATKSDVYAAITATNKMTAGGKISEAQLEANRIAEVKARESKGATASEYDQAKKGGYSKFSQGMLKGFDYTIPGALIGWMSGVKGGAGGIGSGLGTAIAETDQQDIAAKKLRAENMDKAFADISKANKEVATALNGQILVKVANLDELRNSVPGVSPAGRQPSPEDKAGVQ